MIIAEWTDDKKMAYSLYIISVCFLETFFQISARSVDKPNIVFILTDDQDVVIGGQVRDTLNLGKFTCLLKRMVKLKLLDVHLTV